MIYLQHPRDSVIENVDKMINCGNPSFGGAMYGCGHCGNLKFVPFRCKSRFCPTCGNKYSISMLTQHIPEKHFKMIRYYGLYARHRKSDLKLHRAISNEYITEAQLAKELREKYMKNPPEGMTSAEVRSMSDDELLDMDYFFHEFDDINDDDFGEEGFYIF